MTNDTQRLVADEDQWLKGTRGTQLTPNCFYFNLYPKLDHHRAVSYQKFNNQNESHHIPYRLYLIVSVSKHCRLVVLGVNLHVT